MPYAAAVGVMQTVRLQSLTKSLISLQQLPRISGDTALQVWHFYLGRPIVVSEIRPDGSLIETTLGSDLASGQKVQHVIRPGAWFGAHIGDPATGGPFAAMQKVGMIP